MKAEHPRSPIVLADIARKTSTNPYAGLSTERQKHFSRYLSVERTHDGWAVARRPRYAGLVQVGRVAYWLDPPFSAASFVYLLLRRIKARQAADRAFAVASNRRDRSLSELMHVLAVTMVLEAERLGAGHIAQTYVTRTERLGVVRGRPLWHMQGSQPVGGSVMCRFAEKSTDTIENRLVLAGLNAAARWLERSTDRTALRTQQYLWQSLAQSVVPKRHDFEVADLRLNRLTDGYRPALATACALLFGFDLATTEPNTQIFAPVFDLADLFETLVLLVSETATSGTDIDVMAQTSERRAIVTRTGEPYRRIRPDILFSRSGSPILVLDSKFKPKYTSGGEAPPPAHRISREDIFQTFFYGVRIAQSSGLPEPIPSAIAAPMLDGGVPPSAAFRQLRWGEDPNNVNATLTLVLVSVDDAVGAVRSNDVSYCRGLFVDTPLF